MSPSNLRISCHVSHSSLLHTQTHLDFLSLLGRFFGGEAAPVPTRFPEGLQAAQSSVGFQAGRPRH